MKPIALQLWSVQDVAKENFFQTLEKVAEMGYDGVEFAGYYDKSANDLNAKLSELNLKVAGSHIPYEHFLTNIEEVLAYEKELGNQHLVVPWASFESEEEWREFARKMQEIAVQVEAAGMTLSYHNHNHELQKFESESILELLLKTVPNLYFELDTYWIQFAEVDVIPFMEKFATRMKLVHLKDMQLNPKESTEIGNGILDIASFAKEAKRAGVEWFVIEQEAFTQPTLKSVEIGLTNLKRILAEE